MGMYRTMVKVALSGSLLEGAKEYLGPAKEVGGQLKDFFNSPVGRDAAVLGLGASGVGLYKYLKSRQLKKLEEQDLGQGLGQEGQLATDMYPKVGAIVPPPTNAAIAAPPPKPSDLKVPAPSVGGIPSLAGAERRAPSRAIGGPGSASGAATGAAKGQTKTALDPTIMALLAGGLGGTGGYLLGKHLLSPFAASRAEALQEAIRDAQTNMGRWKKVEEFAPAGAAAAGAILLAALAASKARKDEREKMEAMAGQQYAPYDPSNAGFYPEQQQRGFGNFYG